MSGSRCTLEFISSLQISKKKIKNNKERIRIKKKDKKCKNIELLLLLLLLARRYGCCSDGP